MMRVILSLEKLRIQFLKIRLKKSILSTGGSAVYSDEAMEHIQQNSKVIFLDVSFRSNSREGTKFSR